MVERVQLALFDKNWRFPVEKEFDWSRTRLIAGVDEVGRGALAGPVTAAAVILDPENCVEGITDSKQLSARQRERLAAEIEQRALGWSVASLSNEEIDRIHIVEATRRCMIRAIQSLPLQAELVLVDALVLTGLDIPSRSLIKGDALSVNIGAASIIAKVHRDRWMDAAAREFPQYGFDRHKGYGTARHRDSIRRFGECPLHRKSFRLLDEA